MTDTSAATKLHKAFEAQVNQYLSKLIYAVFADIEADMEAGKDPEFSPNLWQTYNNICKPKADRDSVRSRFTIGGEVSQYIRILFFTEILELTQTSADITSADDAVVILKKVEAVVADSATAFMFKLAAEQEGRSNDDQQALFSSTLIKARDPTDWFHNQFMHYLPIWASGVAQYRVLLGRLSVQFDYFLKAVAWSLGNLAWYTGMKTISGDVFIGEMAQRPMSTTMISKIKDQLRPKVVRTKKIHDVVVPTVNIAAESIDPHPDQSVADHTEVFNFED